MLDDKSFASTVIQFRNSKGEVVTLFDVPAFFQDAGMVVQEYGNGGYAVSGWQVDDGPYWNWELWVSHSLSPGAGIKLFAHTKYTSLDEVCGDDPTDYREDSCFIHGSVKEPRALKGTVISKDGVNRYLELDLDACAKEVDIAEPFVKIAGHTKYADDLQHHVDISFYDLENLLYIINGQYFKSYKEFSEAVKEGLSWPYPKHSDLVRIDMAVFRVSNYIKEYANTIPEWSYKWISRREHSGIWFTETCVGETPNWSFSDCDGVWYLGEERVKTLLELKEQHKENFLQSGDSHAEAEKKAEEWLTNTVDKQFRHDMCLLSDFETPYSICTAFYKNSLSTPDEVVTECQALYTYVDFEPDNASSFLKDMVQDVNWTTLPYTVLKETKCKPYPY